MGVGAKGGLTVLIRPLEEVLDMDSGFSCSVKASASVSFRLSSVSKGLSFDCHSLTGSLAVVCTVVGLVLSLLMAFRHGGSLLFVWLVEGCPAQFPAGPWLHLSFLQAGLSTGSSPNRLSADLMVNRRLLLLLQFS